MVDRTRTVNGVRLTHPERVYWPRGQITKMDLVEYYDLVAPLMLPYVADRPVTMVRCPGGLAELPATVRGGKDRADDCFYHKHPPPDFPGPLERVTVEESGGPAPYLLITQPGSLTALAQMATLEIHIWGASTPDLEKPDMLVFDLDPDPTLSWTALTDGAHLVRHILSAKGMRSFVKTTGGKGLHVVAPIVPAAGWEQVRAFCKDVAETMEEQAPDRYTTKMSKTKRSAKIYVDYLRNTRGATSIAPYSTRAREEAPVAYPLHWDEISNHDRPRTHTLGTFSERLEQLGADPWEGYRGLAQTLPGPRTEDLDR